MKLFSPVFQVLLVLTLSACASTPSTPPEEKIPDFATATAKEMDSHSRFRPIQGEKGMVVSDDLLASEWGAEVLRQGGNAVDAAVATAWVLSVTRPHYASIGGGGFLLYCPAPNEGKPSSCLVLDYRETAPRAATRDLFIKDGKPRTDLSQDSALGAGVPGVVAGLTEAHKRWGKRPRALLMSRAIELAEKGFPTSGHLERVARERWSVFQGDTKKIFSCGHLENGACHVGEILKQPDLGRTLRRISDLGHKGFYDGKTARQIVDGFQNEKAILSLEDLKHYEACLRKPITVEFAGHEVVTLPPPGGGLGLAQMLGYAEQAMTTNEFQDGPGSTRSLHALSHAMALWFTDRSKHMGDPAFTDIPVSILTARSYLATRWQDSFKPGRANIPEGPGLTVIPSSGHTTHLSVIDRDGNSVSLTTTVNNNFGSGYTPPGTGVVMNDEMDDFSIQPGLPNLFGLIGSEANAIAPNKRPLSSMTPTIVRTKAGETRLVLGAAGGPRITTSVFQTLVNRMIFGLSLPDSVNAPRIHQQWRPLDLMIERNGFQKPTRDELTHYGYYLKTISESARMHALERFPEGRVFGAPDRRAEGTAIAE